MALPVGQYVKKESTVSGFSNFTVGDTVIVKNTTSNNGIYTVNAITNDGSHSYMGLTGSQITEELDETDVEITPVGTTGDKLIALGDEDSGTINVWSYNTSTSTTGTILESGTPSVDAGTSGWSANAISPVMSGSTAQFVFTPGQSALRVCDANDSNTSIVKHYKFYNTTQFRSSGVSSTTYGTGSFLGWQESDNTLAKPTSGGLLKGVGVGGVDGGDNSLVEFRPQKTEFYGFSSVAATAGESQPQSTDYHLCRSLNLITSGDFGIYETGNDNNCQLKSNEIKDPTATQTYLKLTENSISKIPTGAVIGLSSLDGRVDEGVTFNAERMFVRNIDIDNHRIFVYRGYGITDSATLDISDTPYLVQYGCGFNFTIRYDHRDGGGFYQAGTYEFAQSFVYDDGQESLLRTKKDMANTSTITELVIPEDKDNLKLSIRIGAFGPYPSRVIGGRIYIRESGATDSWSLLADINLEKGARTSLTASYIEWEKVSGTDSDGDADEHRWASGNVPNDCFYVGSLDKRLISKQPSLYTYENINNYYPDIARNSIGYIGESYKCSTVGGERAWYGNVKIRDKSSGTITRFGDRVMFSEYRKYDVILATNYINVSEGDADDIIQVKFFTNKLFIFKSNSVHIWNVSQPEPSNWFPEQTIKNGGLQHPASALDTPYGIVWANRNGCFYHDGKKVIDLTEQKIRDTENSYHGATLPPSWESFIQSSVYTVNPLMIYAPKEKQIYIMKDPTEGGGSENLCYIYNFLTKSWSFNDSIFTDGESYTNPIIDWNDNVVLAHESILDTGIDLDSNFPDNDTDIISSTDNIRFTGGSTNWDDYHPDGTAPAFSHSTANNRLELDHTSTSGNKEGAQLATGNMETRTAGSYYRVIINMHHAGSAGDNIEKVMFTIEFLGTTVDIGTITNIATEYTLDIQCTSATGAIIIYQDGSDGTGTAVETGWYINEVSVKNITLDTNNTSAGEKIMVGDRLKAGTSAGDEEFFVKLVDSDKIVTEPGYNSTSKVAHSSGMSIYSYKAVFKQLSPSSVSTAAPSFITKDYDFDDPSRVKKIYKIYITYLNSSGSAMSNKIKVAADGNTTFSQGSISTPHSASTFALTGSFLGSKSYWDVAVYTFDNPFPCQSIALYYNTTGTANGVSINDISFEYRTLHKRIS
tara:strand:- start:786 stop:4253 length:3468 start_codon:yes stop_codon:yes gene_type:complete